MICCCIAAIVKVSWMDEYFHFVSRHAQFRRSAWLFSEFSVHAVYWNGARYPHVKSETSVAWELRPGLSRPTTWVGILEVPFFYILSPFTRVGTVNLWNEHLDSGDPSSGGGRDLA